jgi:hypothetical protein
MQVLWKDTRKHNHNYKRVRKITKQKYLLRYVFLSDCNNSESTRRNVIKFNIGILFCVVNFVNCVKDTARGRQAKDENIILRMRFICFITNSTNRSEYFNTNYFLTSTTGRRTNLNVTFRSTLPIVFIALTEIWNETPYQLLRLTADPIPPHNYMFERNGF